MPLLHESYLTSSLLRTHPPPFHLRFISCFCAVSLYNGIILYEKLPSKEELWLHGCARTTEAIRRAIQDSKESIAKLAEHYSLNPKTIVKWKKRSFTQDIKMGPKQPKSTVLTQEEEAIIIAFRKHTLLPLDDCLYSLQSTIPHLTRSSLHRCLQRHGISRLPDVEGEVKAKKKFKQYPIGYFHIDIAEVIPILIVGHSNRIHSRVV